MPESLHEPEPPRKSGKRKPERPSGSTIWYVLIAGVILVVLASLLRDGSGKKLGSSEFRKGILSGKFNEKTLDELVEGRQSFTFRYNPRGFTSRGEPLASGQGEEAAETISYRVNLVGLSDASRHELENLLESKDIGFTNQQGESPFRAMAYLLVVPLLLLGGLFFVLHKFGGAGAAMNFGKSRGRLAAQEDIGITFQDIAGTEEAVAELKEIVDFLKNPQKYQALGGRIPRGVLLVGPPGTGKTLLAKAVAGEAEVPFYSLSGSDFVEMFVGVGAARVRDTFQQAASRSPAIIFIDELDALGKSRGGLPGGHDEREQTLNALLVEMDGFSTEQSVIVMGATNRPETLDAALLRPGRFDRNVLVDRPDVKGRQEILRIHSKQVKLGEGVDLHRLARITPGFVGADLANLVNEAALLAARAERNSVTMVEFEEGIERVVAGLEKQGRIIHADEKQRISYHECGHALVACTLPHTDPVHKISIIPRGMGLGYTLHFPEEERLLTTRTVMINRICCLMGGIAAEETVFDETSTGAQNDLQRATEMARRMVTEFGMSKLLGRMRYSESRTSFLGQQAGGDLYHSEQTMREIDLEIKRIIDEANATALEICASRRDVLDAMAEELLEVEVMDADHLSRILARFETRRPVSPERGAFRQPEPVEASAAECEAVGQVFQVDDR